MAELLNATKLNELDIFLVIIITMPSKHCCEVRVMTMTLCEYNSLHTHTLLRGLHQSIICHGVCDRAVVGTAQRPLHPSGSPCRLRPRRHGLSRPRPRPRPRPCRHGTLGGRSGLDPPAINGHVVA